MEAEASKFKNAYESMLTEFPNWESVKRHIETQASQITQSRIKAKFVCFLCFSKPFILF